MPVLEKANRIIEIALENNWITEYEHAPDMSWFDLTCTRGAEVIEISWVGNQLCGPPEYSYLGQTKKLHSAAVVRRKLTETHLQAKRPITSSPTKKSKIASTLPFDIWEDESDTILKACRGATLVWQNGFTGEVEECYVPYVSGGKVFNIDTKNVFYLDESKTGRPYISFMDLNGVFRAVALEALVAVR